MKPDYNVAQFNVMLELGRGDGRARLLAGLAYEPENKKLRLLTFFYCKFNSAAPLFGAFFILCR